MRHRSAIATLLLIAACGGEDAPEVTLDELPLASATETLRLGGPDAPEAFAFARSPGLIVDRDGVLYARLSRDGVVSVFDADGRFLRRIGGRGEGPGEFTVAAGHGFVGDTLWVRNWPAPRISTFLMDGTHLETERTPFDYGYRSAAPTGVTGLLVDGGAYVYPTEFLLAEDGGRVDAAVILADRTLGRQDTILTVRNPPGMHVRDVGVFNLEPVPASPLVRFASDGTGLVVAEWADSLPGLVGVHRLDANGDTTWSRTLRFAPVEIPQAVRDSLISVGVEMARPQVDRNREAGIVISGSVEDLVIEGLALPSHYGPVRAVRVGADGSVWLHRVTSVGGGPWIALDPSGRPRFEVELPADFDLQAIHGSTLWGTILDDLDVPYIVRFEVASPVL